MKHDSWKLWKTFKKGGYLLLLVMLLSVLCVEVYAVLTVYTEGNTPLPATFGNFERVRGLLKTDSQREHFSFAVVGDIQGTGTFERLAGLLKNEHISFLVLLGDCVRNGRSGYHQYFRAELAKELHMSCPTFYVVGDHDVIKDVKKDEFSISRFEEVYGPSIFSFEHEGCLFIVLRILDKRRYSTEESLVFLESVLSASRRDYRKVFVFMHIPPPVSADFVARQFENPDKFVSLCDTFKVDYVIAGDYHGYARVERGDTVYLVTGGGGGHLEREKPGAFHHAVLITVGPQAISERILAVGRDEELEDMIERWAIAEVYPLMRKHVRTTILLNLVIICCCVLVFHRFLKLRRHYKDT